MKIAVVQDWLVVNGGAEKVLKEICAYFDYNVDVFALVDFLNDDDRKFILNGKKVKTSFIQNLPYSKTAYRNYLPLFPLAIESFDFSGYDLIISSSYAVAKGVKKASNQIHICYCHSPIRYAWDLENEYLSDFKGLKKMFVKLVLSYIRKWDIKTLSRVDYFIANSEYIAERIKRIYNRDAEVIYPPVNIEKFIEESEKDNYYFTASRLVSYKKVDIIVQVFNELPQLKLIVSGNGPELKKLMIMAKENITFVGFLEEIELIKHIQKAKAFILAANEDFGITSIEAQSCFTPVLALNKGGYKETVLEGKTGLFFEDQNVVSLKKVVLQFEQNNIKYKPEDFKENINKFSSEAFNQKLKNIINKYVKK